jgi:hypothetical protein
MELHQIKSPYTSKEKHDQNEETTHRMGEYLCQLFNEYRINIENIQEFKKLNTQRTNKWENVLISSQKKYKCY